MRRRFSLFKTKKSDYYYCQLKNPVTGQYTAPKSTGCTDRDEAVVVVNNWIEQGVPTGNTVKKKSLFTTDSIIYSILEGDFDIKDAERIVHALQAKGLVEKAIVAGDGEDSRELISYLKHFWDYDNSEYVREKLAYGQSIGRGHCEDMTLRLNHWKDFFPEGTRIKDLSREGLHDFQLHLKGGGLASKTVNSIMSAGTVALAWMKQRGVISEDPSSGLRKFSGGEKKRGILTPSEVQSVFSVRWYDYRAKVGNLIAATCGLRSGEILGLRFQDIQEDRIHVKHSMSRADGLKKPKNGETRVVPLLPAVRKEILALMKQNPFGQEDEHFIFFSEDVTKPMSPNILRRGLERALVDITLSKKDRKDSKKVLDVKQKWKDRGICVHSWRHYYATNLADRIDMRTVQLATGHKSGVMAEHYADHANAKHFQEIAAAAGNAFGNFIEFPRGETESHKEAVQ